LVALLLSACAAPDSATPPPLSTGRASAEARPPVAEARDGGRATGTTPPEGGSAARYSFDRSVPPPRLENRGDDYPAIIESLAQYWAWVDGHDPDLAHVPELAAPGTIAETAARTEFGHLARHDQRLYDVMDGPSWTEVVDARPGVVSAWYFQRLVNKTIVERSGRVVHRTLFPSPVTRFEVLIVKVPDGPDGRWLFARVGAR
jgi:hypothetical protein